MIKYYDKQNNRLVYVERKADADFWDARWGSDDFKRRIIAPRNRFLLKTTKRYLKPGARVLEGGCGIGDKVYSLRKHGYEAYGVDIAAKTVERVKQVLPDLKITLGDVRDLKFENGFFDGYWSLGVIEHFYDGYEQLLSEMFRVLKKDGYLFVVAPTMSWIRKFKAERGKYPPYSETPELIAGFFQFALDPPSVITSFERGGFELIKHGFPNDVEGLKNEVKLVEKPMQFLYNSPNLPVKLMRICVGSVTRLFAGNTSFYVFRKK